MALFSTFPNAHDAYGDFADLDAATLEDAAAFFDRYYAPANAVLAIAGDVDPDEATVMIERLFGDIEKRPADRRGRHDVIDRRKGAIRPRHAPAVLSQHVERLRRRDFVNKM